LLQDRSGSEETNHLSGPVRTDNTPLGDSGSDRAEAERVVIKSDGPSERDTGVSPLLDGRHEGLIAAIETAVTAEDSKIEAYGIPCMVEIFSFLCSLLNIDDPQSPGQLVLAGDEDSPQFALMLINSAIELGGEALSYHPKLLALIQDELFRNLMVIGLLQNPLVLSLVFGVVLNLYHHLRRQLKFQLEAFFSYVLIRLASGKNGATYQQQEVALEALVDLCRQPTFMPEMYANFDCDIALSNTFEDLGNLLSKSAFPVNCPLSATHVLALEGLLAVVRSMADRVDTAAPALASSSSSRNLVVDSQEFVPFWTLKCEDYDDPGSWVQFVKQQKHIKARIVLGADHFNRDPKKGLEFLQGMQLLPPVLDPKSVACFIRYITLSESISS
jgi:brefeldin A-resistance guanine nucleotide exchange factor 1